MCTTPPHETWFLGVTDGFATCPITQGSLIRLLIRECQTAEAARSILRGLAVGERHEFWPDDITYADIPTAGIIGRRHVTDAYLAQLALSRASRLATFDQALAQIHADVADLVPTS